ncbi:hypothetical protein JTE90_015254 [Oedothorax gibbosus]|uniref:Major facilitator superfamily (MFS) profile domain-containing protein n=1 Tax=Oedothorax gibbosus TaxID=931172 RepID=A0AAV6U0T1_9ARAC|nr:hypothetical protein JTE90_015254 [Oedothorax gibbosus]
MTFENILEEAGGFGRYQKSLLIGYFIPCFTIFPWFSMHVIFITSIPDHWCYIPLIAKSNLSLETQKQLIKPESKSKCLMYDVDYSKVLRTHRLNVGPHTPTVRCNHGWAFDKSTYVETSTTRWNMVCQYDIYVPLILASTFIGVFIGTPFYTAFSERFGHRLAFFVSATVICISEVGSAYSPDFTLFVLLRIFGGSAVSTIQSTTYLIVLELVSPKLRTRLNGISTISWAAGSSTVPFLAWLTADWRKLCGLNSVCAAAMLLLYFRWIPESPRWLMSKNKHEEAVEILKNISRFNDGTAHEDSQLINRIRCLGVDCRTFVEEQKNVSHKEFFRHPGIRRRLLILTMCWMLNSMPYYGLMMNTRFLYGDPFLNYFLAAMVEVPSHLATFILLEGLGRRWTTVLALACTSVACFMPFIFRDAKGVGIVSTFFAKAACSASYMTLNIQASELFPNPLRPKAIRLCCTAGVCGSIVAPFIVYLYKFGAHLPFLVFSVLMAVAAVCSSFLLETRGKPLSQTIAEAEESEKHWKFFSSVCCTSTENDETSWREVVRALPDFSDSATPRTYLNENQSTLSSQSCPNLNSSSS